MTHYKTDGETKVRHIAIGGITLCGIMEGWTHLGDIPVKEKWGSTCGDCQIELEDLRTIKK